MRIVPVIGLLAGCNWVFGLADTSPAVPEDGTTPTHVSLTRQVLLAPGMPPDLLPIGSTTFGVARLDQPTEIATVDVDDVGGFDLPDAVVGQPYRIIYQLPEDTFSREIVWNAGTDYVVPLFGRADRMPAPNASISFTAMGGVPGFFDPFVFTSGVWSRIGLGSPGGSRPNPVIDNYLTSTPMGGPLGKLVATDTAWLIDYECPDPPSALCMNNRGLPSRAIGFAKAHFDMTSGTNAISGPWQTAPVMDLPLFTFDDLAMRNRLADGVIGHLDTVGTTQTLITTGVIPSYSMPASTQLREDGGLADPVMIPLASSSDGSVLVPPATPVNPFTNADALPVAVAATWVNSRVVNGTQLTSGFAQVQAPETVPAKTAVDPCVDIARDVTIHDPATTQDPVALKNEIATLPFIGTSPQLEVRFTLDDDPTMRPMSCVTNNIVTQACSVTVFEFDPSGKLHTKRVVDTVVTPPTVTVEIDSSAFEIDHDFVLGIVCRSGYDPGAFAQGRFDAIQYPFSTSTHYPAAFHTMAPM